MAETYLHRPDEFPRGRMVGDLRTLVEAESPSGRVTESSRSVDVLDAIGERLLGASAERSSVDGSPILRWHVGEGGPGVLLLGHLDTVWPVGSTAARPFELRDGMAYGPGIFDMKAGLVIALWALHVLGNRCNATLLVNADEELGSPNSTSVVRQAASVATAALVLEPSHHGRLKTRRWGRTLYRFGIMGRSAHAGLAASEGANALSELARIVQQVETFASEDTTVVPTLGSGGAAPNVVPDRAELMIDVRFRDATAQSRVDRLMREVRASATGIDISLTLDHVSSPLERDASHELFREAQVVASSTGLAELEEAEVGGGSDGNTCASVGCATLDGLGAVGDGAHAEYEHVEISSLAERTALVAGLVGRLSRHQALRSDAALTTTEREGV